MEQQIPCYKVSFSSYADAMGKLSDIHSVHRKKARPDGKEPVRAYECKRCGQYHLTSQTEDRRKVDKNRKADHPKRVVKSYKDLNTNKKLSDEADFWFRKKQWKNK